MLLSSAQCSVTRTQNKLELGARDCYALYVECYMPTDNVTLNSYKILRN